MAARRPYCHAEEPERLKHVNGSVEILRFAQNDSQKARAT